MITYLIKVIGCSGLLLLVYLLLLQREKMYRFNRVYLLFSVIASFFIPLIPVTLPARPPEVIEATSMMADSRITIIPEQVAIAEVDTSFWPTVLIICYMAVTAFLLCRFAVNLFSIYRTIHNNRKVTLSYATVVLTTAAVAPHSFLRYIFINQQEYENGQLKEEILRHEQTHVKQQHSLDILLLEFLLICCWINPFLFLYRKAIQLNHEFLADESVINTFHDAPAYQQLLLNTLTRGRNVFLSSSFNYLVTKKRLVMMNKSINRKAVLLKQAALLPVLAATVFLFSTKMYAQQPVQQLAQALDKPEQKAPPATTATHAKRPLINSFARPLIPYGQGATSEELTAYDEEMKRIVEKSTNEKGKEVTSINMKAGNEKKIIELFKKMNRQQRSDRDEELGAAFIYFTTPHAKPALTTAHLEDWSDAASYAVWIDRKRIDNSDLKNYKPSDFTNYMENRVYSTPQKKISYKVEVNLYTKPLPAPPPIEIFRKSK